MEKVPCLPVSPHGTGQAGLEVCQYLLEVLIHDCLAVRNDGRPDAGHGQLNARVWVILVPVQAGHDAG